MCRKTLCIGPPSLRYKYKGLTNCCQNKSNSISLISYWRPPHTCRIQIRRCSKRSADNTGHCDFLSSICQPRELAQDPVWCQFDSKRYEMLHNRVLNNLTFESSAVLVTLKRFTYRNLKHGPPILEFGAPATKYSLPYLLSLIKKKPNGFHQHALRGYQNHTVKRDNKLLPSDVRVSLLHTVVCNACWKPLTRSTMNEGVLMVLRGFYKSFPIFTNSVCLGIPTSFSQWR